MRAGDLRHQFVIQQAQESRDSMGAVLVVWVAFATVPGAFRTTGGDEQFLGNQVHERADAIMTIRYLSGLTSKMRVVFGGRLWNVLRVSDPDGRQVLLELAVQAGLTDGG